MHQARRRLGVEPNSPKHVTKLPPDNINIHESDSLMSHSVVNGQQQYIDVAYERDHWREKQTIVEESASKKKLPSKSKPSPRLPVVMRGGIPLNIRASVGSNNSSSPSRGGGRSSQAQ